MSDHNKPSNHIEEKTSTPDVKQSNLFRILIFIFLSIVTLITITKIINRPKKVVEQKIESTSRNIANETPNIYTEYYTLKKGKAVRVNVPSEYSYTCSGGGKKYYHQAQNVSKPEIWGDGNYHDTGKHVAYFDLSCYDEEITVVCEFKKLQ